jgi:hypothetical protein
MSDKGSEPRCVYCDTPAGLRPLVYKLAGWVCAPSLSLILLGVSFVSGCAFNEYVESENGI